MIFVTDAAYTEELNRRAVLACSASACCFGLMMNRAVAEPAALGHARAIADAAVTLPAEAPAPVASRVAWTVLDAMGAILYASTLPDAMAAARYFAGDSRRGAVHVPATGFAASDAAAAAAIAFLIHAAEIDDSDMRGQLRASSVILSATLAAAQAADSSGAAFIRAAALGYTLQGRFVAPVGAIQGRGWMASGVWGPPSAAAAVALLRGQPAEEIASAISLACASSGGLFQYYFDQTEEKRLIVARGARAAVESAELAALGEHGAAHAIEGKSGLYSLFAGSKAPPAEHFTASLGELEGPLFVRPKFFAASHSIIPTLDGLAAAAPQGVAAGSVESIVIRGDSAWGEVIGDKINAFEAPHSRIGAALNFSFVVAMWIARGRVLPTDYTEATMEDETILALARNTSFETAPGEHLSIEVRLKNGETIRASAVDPDPEEPAPLDEARRVSKFEGLARSRLSQGQAEALRTHCLAVGEAESMRDWARRARSICE